MVGRKEEWEEDFLLEDEPRSIDEEAFRREYETRIDVEAARASARRVESLPKEHGEPMGERGYFCMHCWRAGGETGYHGREFPPCEG